MQLPVHKAVLAAASPVFADLFVASAESAATAEKQSSLLSTALTGHTQAEVQVALKFLYEYNATGFATLQSKYSLHCADTARPILQFAHKYDLKGILKEYEIYLDAKAKGRPASVFTSGEETVTWAALAEQCGLSTLLAHAEVYMLSSLDDKFWTTSAFAKHALSRDCMLRMLRAGQSCASKSAFRYTVSLTDLLQWHEDSIGNSKEKSASCTSDVVRGTACPL